MPVFCGDRREADFSTFGIAAQAAAWVPGADGDSPRTSDYSGSAAQGTLAAFGLILALPPTLRLRARSHFAALFERGNKFHGRRIVVRVCANGGEKPRLGVGISKKRVRLAVARNRIRRALAGAFAESAATLPPLDMLVSVKEDAGKNDGKRLAAELRYIFPRIRKYVARHAAAARDAADCAAQTANGESPPNAAALNDGGPSRRGEQDRPARRGKQKPKPAAARRKQNPAPAAAQKA